MTRASHYDFENPVRLCFGRGRSAELERWLVAPVLFVAGPTSLARTQLDRLVSRTSDYHAFSEVPPNPGPEVVDRGIRAARAVEARTVVGVGGGSPLDAAKSIAVTLGHAPDVASFQRIVDHQEGANDLERTVRLLQVPTTAGTGSEVTCWASLWNPDGSKWSMDAPSGYADVALVDPALSDGMSPRLTAATGLDALSHAVESIWGVHSNPVSDLYATRSLGLIRAHLMKSISDPTSAHRDAMAAAAMYAGLALSNCRSAAAHALSYALTGRHGIDHGIAVGILCRGLLPVTEAAAPERVAEILGALGFDRVAEMQQFIDEAFRAAGIEPSLESMGVAREDFEAVVETACGADRLSNHPGALDRSELRAVLDSIA